MKRLTNTSTHRITTRTAVYNVTLTRLKNTASGCPRWDVVITNDNELKARYWATSYHYHMNGHYFDELGEAEEAVRQHEELIKGE